MRIVRVNKETFLRSIKQSVGVSERELTCAIALQKNLLCAQNQSMTRNLNEIIFLFYSLSSKNKKMIMGYLRRSTHRYF